MVRNTTGCDSLAEYFGLSRCNSGRGPNRWLLCSKPPRRRCFRFRLVSGGAHEFAELPDCHLMAAEKKMAPEL